eukprot:gene11953-14118_t
MDFLRSFLSSDAPVEEAEDLPTVADGGQSKADATSEEEEEEEEGGLEDMVRFFYDTLDEAGEQNQALKEKMSEYMKKDTARDEMLKLKANATRKLKHSTPRSEILPSATAEELSQDDIENRVKNMRNRIKEESLAVKKMERELPAEAVELRQHKERLLATTDAEHTHGFLEDGPATEAKECPHDLAEGASSSGPEVMMPAHDAILTVSSAKQASDGAEQDDVDHTLAAHKQRLARLQQDRAELLLASQSPVPHPAATFDGSSVAMKEHDAKGASHGGGGGARSLATMRSQQEGRHPVPEEKAAPQSLLADKPPALDDNSEADLEVAIAFLSSYNHMYDDDDEQEEDGL